MKKVLLISTVFVSLLFTSCYTSRVYHGNTTENTPQIKVASKNNPILLWGLLPLSGSRQQAKDIVGNRTDYTTKTSWTFVNGLLNFITLGIYTPTTTSYYLPIENGYYQNGYNQQPQGGYYQNRPMQQQQPQGGYYQNTPVQQQQYQDGYYQNVPVQQYEDDYYPNAPVQQYQIPPVPQNQQKQNQNQNPPARPANRSNSQYY